MTTTRTAWPFDTDAVRDDPLTALRVPAVTSFNPMWKYVAAYLVPTTGDLAGPPFGSNERPNDAEAAMLASFIQEYLDYFFNERYIRRLAKRPLDVDGRCVTTVFIKYGTDDWGYRLATWQSGPPFIPQPPTVTDRARGPLTLAQVMDLRHTIGVGEPMQHWLDWKTAHPEVFR